MKSLLFLVITVISNLEIAAYSQRTFLFKDSEPVDNVFVRVYFSGQSTNLLSNEKISYCFLAESNSPSILYFPKSEYFCKMELVNSDGIAVQHTDGFKLWGRSYSLLNSYSWDVVNKKGHNTGGSDRPDMTLIQVGKAQGRDFPTVEQLFEVSKAGEYKLSLQFQVFKSIGEGTNQSFKIVHLPSVEVPVFKL